MPELSPEKTSSSNINTMIRRIKKAQETNNLRVHNCIVMIAEHTVAYNDCSGFARLLNSLPAGLARNSSVMIDTMKEYTPITADVKNGVFVVRIAKEGTPNHKPFDVDGLRANPWFTRAEASRDPAIISLDTIGDKLLKMADSILKKIQKGEADAGQTAELTVLANSLRVFAKTSIPAVVPASMTHPEEQDTHGQPEEQPEEQTLTMEDLAPALRSVG